MTSTQPSQLLASLFQPLDEEQRLSVFDVGPARPETISFFSHYRSKLYLADMFAELPICAADEGSDLGQRFDELLNFPNDTRFDLCLFWDLFNYLSEEAIAAFLERLAPCLHPGSMAHAFAVHNVRSPQADQLYGIRQADALSVRQRDKPLPGYAPHNQGRLKSLLHCFEFERTVLLADSRLELLLRFRPRG
jgi:hypothetical protein